MRFVPSQVVLACSYVVGTIIARGTNTMDEGNLTRLRPGVPLAPVPLPPAGPARDGAEIVRQLMGLTRAGMNGGGGDDGGSRLRFVKKVELEGDVWEPEGIVRLMGAGGDDDDDEQERFWVSAGEYTVPTEKFPDGRWIDGTDRSAGAGFAHFVVFDGRGRRLADWVVSKEGDAEYHNGGLDYDGRHIWATLSQYRPNSTATVVRVDPVDLRVERVFRVGDHQGGVVHDVETGTLTTLSWGGRVARRWDLKGGDGGGGGGGREEEQVRLVHGDGVDSGTGFDVPEEVMVNPSHWIDYQDCKSLGRVGGRSLALCSGIATLAAGIEVGGLAVVDVDAGMTPVWEMPFMERTTTAAAGAARGALMTKNPMDVALVGGRVRLYFAPEEGRGAVFVYEVCEG
ncbi:Putative quinoprotein amine dehydrogenase, beta chain [Colletotrichum destructivum]|uniref:Quinoprotein amine dehydrogenase, beta chain n=1 Tax=Colletotrichum destructivum TaxID=34406 RepID=A0AAX4J1V4_9PEZI|nr:Putative quinoprotein amine dehydrogenase, beta chain [Colletotrichum destructivum]